MNIKDLPIVTPSIINTLWVNKKSINNNFSRYFKQWKFTRIKRWFYINSNKKIDILQLSNMIFPNSYISLDNILYENWIIKQYSKSVYSVSNTTKSSIIYLWAYKLYNFRINIDSDLGIIIDNSWIRKVKKERAIFDSIYLKMFSSNYPWDSEMNINDLDKKLINKLMSLYPKRVQKYFIKKINE